MRGCDCYLSEFNLLHAVTFLPLKDFNFSFGIVLFSIFGGIVRNVNIKFELMIYGSNK